MGCGTDRDIEAKDANLLLCSLPPSSPPEISLGASGLVPEAMISAFV